MALRRVIAMFGLSAVLLAGCDRAPARVDPEPLAPAWQQVTLPAPPGASGRLLLRDAVACAGRWYLVGGVADAAGGTRPAAWTSTDGPAWRNVPIRADSFYGRQNVLYAVGCRDGVAAVIGAKVGGAHGYPRVSTWRQLPDGGLVEVQAPFETFGGPKAVNVSRLAGGPAGWLIAGNRSSGAAAWVSPDAAEFALVEGAPELATDATGVSWAFDAVAGPAGWLAVGGLLPPGRIDRDPAVWASSDGRSWQRTVLPGSRDYEELQRVVLVDGVPVAVGLRGGTFGAWRQEPGGWVAAGGFGRRAASGVPSVTSLVAAGGRLVVAVSDGERHSVWESVDRGGSWRAVRTPAEPLAGADRDVALVAVGDRWWLAVDDGQRGGLWTAPVGSGS
ncbi:hypothetical protein AB0C04_08760 [Micromonospora sp. NPDC048909]|uniref:hypothetical protein n=1 Tax=Micromonospora sp. NPDC048909 TaxID=3155643 RepID=UPI0033FCB068